LLGEIPIKSRLRNPQRPADVLDGIRRVAVKSHSVPLLLVIEVTGPAALPPACSGSRETGESSLPDDVPLELGQGAEDVEDQLAARASKMSNATVIKIGIGACGISNNKYCAIYKYYLWINEGSKKIQLS
jgi:hypothetical protein